MRGTWGTHRWYYFKLPEARDSSRFLSCGDRAFPPWPQKQKRGEGGAPIAGATSSMENIEHFFRLCKCKVSEAVQRGLFVRKRPLRYLLDAAFGQRVADLSRCDAHRGAQNPGKRRHSAPAPITTSPLSPRSPEPKAERACTRSRRWKPGPGGSARHSGRRRPWRTRPSRCAQVSPESARG
jgi:hypothetical protein